MAEGLDCAIVAEGIEALEQVSILSKIGCNEFQGYLFSRPLPVREIERWLSRVSATVEAMKQDQVALLRPV